MEPDARRALLGREIAFIPQEPLSALNPVLAIGSQFEEHLARIGVAARERRDRMLAAFDAVHLQRPADCSRAIRISSPAACASAC